MKNPFIAIGADHVRLNEIREFFLAIAAAPATDIDTRNAARSRAQLVDEASLYAVLPARIGELEIDVLESDCERVEVAIFERAYKGAGLEYFGATITYRWDDRFGVGEWDKCEIEWHSDCSGGPIVSSPCSLIGPYAWAIDEANRIAIDAHEACVDEAIEDIRINGED